MRSADRAGVGVGAAADGDLAGSGLAVPDGDHDALVLGSEVADVEVGEFGVAVVSAEFRADMA
ncbi:hypothetical protein [Nocardia brasiliensis]|uniref:hypothetical protein n=1 Tax=Nocardia brasiliensis TaxID=37326 RepID=UPI002454835B|nr:hypothetical protein [Nocardia brasiliensis]